MRVFALTNIRQAFKISAVTVKVDRNAGFYG